MKPLKKWSWSWFKIMLWRAFWEGTLKALNIRKYPGHYLHIDFNNLPVNHKGTWCCVNPRIFCQEGFCSSCQIWYDFTRMKETEGGGVDKV
ncbi:hypothetical protein ES707_01948 [subsurface metagenome]